MADWLSERQRSGGIDVVPLPDGVPGTLRLCGKRAIADGQFADDSPPWDTVVCLCRRHELAARYPDYVAWLDAEQGARSLWWEMPDLGTRAFDEMVPFIDDLVARLRAGDRLLVHCAAGIGRAGTTAVAVLVRLGLTLDESLHVVRSARVGAGPEVGTQLELVRRLADSG